MVLVRLQDVQQAHLALGVGAQRVRRNLEAGDHGIQLAALPLGIVDEKVAVVGVIGMEGQPQQAALAAAVHPAGQVEEGVIQQAARLPDADAAALLKDEQPP